MAGIQVEEQVKMKISPIKMYDVVFFNDDYTPMEFVVSLLTNVFKHDSESAISIMMKVHVDGSAVVGTYIYEIADEKKEICGHNAAIRGYPLRVEISESSSEI